MNKLRKFLRWNATERGLVMAAWFVVTVIRLLLWAVPFRYLRVWSAALSTAGKVRGSQLPLAELVLAVQRSSACVPCATCLVKALAGQAFLGIYGYRTALCIGVAKDNSGRFLAHAWLEYSGNVVIGANSDREYMRLPSVSGVSSPTT